MKRKNKRHDLKSSPEKSPEKPSRRSNRHSKRRRKSSSSSSSPEREKAHSKLKDTVAVKNISAAKSNEKVRSYTPELVTEKVNKEVVEKNVEQEAGSSSSRRSSKRHSGNEQSDPGTTSDKVALVKKDEGGGDNNEWKEDKSFWEGDEKVEESADNKGKEKDSGSVWKVQSANGAGGEIQKLKICRQRMADSQSQDESPGSPKRRSTRIKENIGQKNPDEVSSENDDVSIADGSNNEKTSKLKIRTRTSSRNSPALLDSPKVVCDVSEDNPTKIKIHIENKSPEKAPLTSPLSNNGNADDISVVKSEGAVNVEAVDDVKDSGKNDTSEEQVKEKGELEEVKIVENKEGEAEENITEESKSVEQLQTVNKVEVDEEKKDGKETEKDSPVVLDTSEIIPENIELPEGTPQVVEGNQPTEVEPNSIAEVETPRRSSSSHNSTPRREEKEDTNSTSGSTSDGSNNSESEGSDSDGKKVKRKKHRKGGMQSTVTRQPQVVTEDSGREAPCGKQEPEEEGELEEGEAVGEEGEVDVKITPAASDKENSNAVEPQSSLVSAPSEPVQKKRRWGASKSIRPPKKPVLCISTDSLKNLIPEAKPVSIEEVRLSVDEDGEKDSDREEREKTIEVKEIIVEDSKVKKEKKEVKKEKEKDRDRDRHIRVEKDDKDVSKEDKKLKDKKESTKILKIEKPSTTDKVSRRICVLSEDARKLVRSPSPARHRPSSVLFITNLVRPFTVPQLRNLLARTGKIADNGFWIDKIKSKCYVQYTDEEAAIETRHALHGVRWPVSNPRTLCVEFASYDDMAVAQALSEETEPIPRKAEPLQVDHSVEGWLADQARINIDRTQRRVVREWDVGKPAHPDEELDMRPSRPDYDDVRERERERDRERDRRLKKERHPRSRSPDPHEPPVRKPRRKDEDAPAKLLDDLFRKTKTSPCIYWLPLTAEQIVVKEEMRRQHMAEHERRVAEMKKAEQARRDRERRRK